MATASVEKMSKNYVGAYFGCVGKTHNVQQSSTVRTRVMPSVLVSTWFSSCMACQSSDIGWQVRGMPGQGSVCCGIITSMLLPAALPLFIVGLSSISLNLRRRRNISELVGRLFSSSQRSSSLWIRVSQSTSSQPGSIAFLLATVLPPLGLGTGTGAGPGLTEPPVTDAALAVNMICELLQTP